MDLFDMFVDRPDIHIIEDCYHLLRQPDVRILITHLHTPVPGGLSAFVGQWRLFSFPPVIQYQCVFVAAEVGKQPPPFLLFVRGQYAFNGMLPPQQ